MITTGEIKAFVADNADALSDEAKHVFACACHEMERLWLENFRLKADGGPGTMALLREAGVENPTYRQVMQVKAIDRGQSWNDIVAEIRRMNGIPEPAPPARKPRKKTA